MHEKSEQQYLVNKTYDEIAVGDTASLTRTLMPEDVKLFAILTGDVNPATEDILIGQTAEVEKLQWFVRAHLENATGSLRTLDDASEEAATRDASA